MLINNPNSSNDTSNQANNDVGIIILAAGKGTRMKSQIPKPLFKISGKYMLSHTIAQSKKISDDITVVLHYKYELIQKEINKEFSNIKYHIQDVDNFSGTGGAIMGIGIKKKYTIVLNSDMPLVSACEIKMLIDKNNVINMSVLKLKNAGGYGRVDIDTNKNVIKIIEEKDCSKKELKIKYGNGGVYCFNSSFLKQNLPKLNNSNNAKEYYITDLVTIALSQNKKIKSILVNKRSFLGVNSKLDLEKCERISQKIIKTKHMLNGVCMKNSRSIYIDNDVVFEGECFLDSNISLLGKSVLKNTYIKSNSIVQDSNIDNSTIGPFARIRPNCKIKDSFVGNFVEIKNSVLTNVKAGHLSYLGDSSIDSGTNIGAGCITCNYDGKTKHKTIIGKNVFLGSNSALVAPLIIEDDVLIGASSTITQDVTKGSLVTARVNKPTVLKNYFYKFFAK